MDINNMSLEMKCGQVLSVGFKGTTVTEEIEMMIRDYHVGSIILFDRNFESAEQLFHVIKELQGLSMKYNGIPLFIGIDQEGGMVTRLYKDVTFFPGNMAVSAGATDDEVYSLGKAMGKELYNLGVNFNFAPSCDINNNPKNPVINVRSYGDNPQRVADLASLFSKGMQDEGIIATAKHFPGHGDTEVDSHLGLPVVNHDRERLNTVELLPFKRLIQEGVKSIMAAHIVFPAYDTDRLPSTISKNILTNLLREELGYEGIVITDCMEMQAIQKEYGTVNAVPMSLAAGADIMLVSHTLQKQIDAYHGILKQVKDGTIAIELLNAAVTRVLKGKEPFLSDPTWEKNFADIKHTIGSAAHMALAEKVSRKSITLVRENSFLPLKEKFLSVIFTSKDPVTLVDSLNLRVDLEKALQTGMDTEVVTLSHNPDETAIKGVLEKAKEFEKTVVFTYNATAFPNQALMVNELLKCNRNVMVMAMRSPYDINEFTEIQNYAVTYECTSLSVKSTIQFLQGKIKGDGSLPVKLV